MRGDDERAYVDRPVEAFGEAAALAQQAAAQWRLGEPTLIRTGMNAIFGAGNTVLRVGRPNGPASASIELAERLNDQGIRVVRPRRDDALERGDLSVTCWERIEPISTPIDWVAIGEMVRIVHSLDPAVVPPDYPVPRPSSFPWWNFDALLDETGDALDDAARSGLVAAIERWPDWRRFDDSVICHGDIHPGNVLMAPDGPILIDWDLLCLAPRGWDHAPLMTWSGVWGGDAGMYEDLARGYGISKRGDQDAEAFAELRLVAATLMRIRAGKADAAAMPEAQRRLRYWRGDPDAPAWRAQ